MEQQVNASTIHPLTQFLKRTLIPIAAVLLLIAILSTVFRALTPMLSGYKPQVEALLTSVVGKPVSLEKLETGWYWFEPVMKVSQVQIHESGQTALNIKQVQLGLDLLGSLFHWRIQPGWLLVDGVTLNLKQTQAGWTLNGLGDQSTTKTQLPESALAIVLGHQRLQIKDVHGTISLEDGRHFKFKNLNATLANRLGEHRLKGSLTILDPAPTVLYFGAELLLSPTALEQTSGRVYFKTNQLNLHSALFKISEIQKGEGQIEVWGDVNQGRLTALQGQVQLTQLILQSSMLKKPLPVDRLNTHFAWLQRDQGFQLTASNLQLTMPDGDWPETDVLLEKNASGSMDLYVKELDLQKLLNLPLVFPSDILVLKRFQVHGILNELKVTQAQTGVSLLTRFTDLSWRKQDNIPGLSHLSGVLHWTTQGGHLALDSESVKLNIPKRQSLSFPRANLDLKWAKRANGLGIQLSHLFIEHPHLSLNMKGVVEGAHEQDWGQVDMSVQFSAKDAQFWLPYLPKEGIKPKLYHWLRHGIHRLAQADGTALVSGPLHAFPFDHHEGKFKINTILKGVDLDFAPHWPMAQDVDGRLSVKGRILEANISSAKIAGAPIDAVNLQVNHLGLDRERLWVHGVVASDAELAWPVLLGSPLAKSYPILSAMTWSGPMALDVNLDVALYPGNDDVLVHGQVVLKKNQLGIGIATGQLPFESLTGTVAFDEHGLLSSHLQASLWDEPLLMKIRSQRKPHPLTTISTTAKVAVKPVFKTFHVEPSDMIQGAMMVDATLLLPSGKEAESTLKLESNLQGLQLNVGSFFAKPAEDIRPFEALFTFYPNSSFKLAMNYDKQIDIKRNTDGLWSLLSSPALGHLNLQYQVNEHKLSGQIDTLRVSDAMKSDSNEWSINPGSLPALDVTIQHLHVGTFDLGQAVLKAKPASNSWTLDPWELDTPEYTVQGKATWKQQDDRQESHLLMDLQTSDVSRFLARFHEPIVLEKGKGYLHVDTHWKKALWQGSLENMEGELSLSIKRGRTKNLSRETESKLGLGKLFSLLSLQTIPRRLMLDFSDLSNDGYSFDELSGDFTLERGMLQSKTCSIDGPVAYASIQGRIDLIKKVYDLSIQISPHITASLPIVATIAGGPVVGMATWVASKILNPGVQKIASYTYRVSGPWADPVIEEVKLYRAR